MVAAQFARTGTLEPRSQRPLRETYALAIEEQRRANAARPVRLIPAEGCALVFERVVVDLRTGKAGWKPYDIPLDQIARTITTVGSA